MGEELNALALGYAAGVVSAAVMLLLGILGNAGVYMGAVQMMQDMHLFFSLSIVGIIAGMLETAVVGFVLGYALGLVYNMFV